LVGQINDLYPINGINKNQKKHGIKDYKISKEELKNKNNFKSKNNK
jgi:hypothetical protein